MTESKKIIISLPESVLKDFDEILGKDDKNRSEFIKEAIILYIEEKKRYKLRERLISGYLEMSKLNQEIAEFGLAMDCCDYCSYEASLSECDNIDGNGGKKRRYILC